MDNINKGEKKREEEKVEGKIGDVEGTKYHSSSTWGLTLH